MTFVQQDQDYLAGLTPRLHLEILGSARTSHLDEIRLEYRDCVDLLGIEDARHLKYRDVQGPTFGAMPKILCFVNL